MIGATFADPWKFEANPEVYLLVVFLIAAYVYAMRVIGPRAVAHGQPVFTHRNVWCFTGALVLLFTATLNTTAATTGLVMNVTTRHVRPVPTSNRSNHVGVASSTSGGMK